MTHRRRKHLIHYSSSIVILLSSSLSTSAFQHLNNNQNKFGSFRLRSLLQEEEQEQRFIESDDHDNRRIKRIEMENDKGKTAFSHQQQRDEEPYLEISFEDYFDGTKPDSSWNLGYQNFMRQGRSIIEQSKENLGLKQSDPFRPPYCLKVTLSNDAVKETEERRMAAGDGVDVHPVARQLYDVGCLLLDKFFEDRPIPRFWFLETIARIPYFSYVTCLHLYESFGWFRAVELRKVHAAQDWNELHHLLIMESLGGNAIWSDRFLGYHTAFLYYWALVLTYLCSPRVAYQFMELLEAHAVDTYSTFVRENRVRLQQLPPPTVAKSYYTSKDDYYLFDDFQITRTPGSRRPPCDTLLDVFTNISQDEGEHVKTMKACQNYASYGTKVVSSHLNYHHHHQNNNNNNEKKKKMEEEEKEQMKKKKREQWKQWSDEINNNKNHHSNNNNDEHYYETLPNEMDW